jgi:hypothetical protein
MNTKANPNTKAINTKISSGLISFSLNKILPIIAILFFHVHLHAILSAFFHPVHSIDEGELKKFDVHVEVFLEYSYKNV